MIAKQADETVSSAPAAPAVEMTFAEFLESCPAETQKFASDVLKYKGSVSNPYLEAPDLELHCEYEGCNGIRTFECRNEPALPNKWQLEFLVYLCRNCRRTTRTFALLINREGQRGTSAL